MSQTCSGWFSYISDQSMVGTIFVNFISAMLCVCCSECEIKLNIGEGKLTKQYGSSQLGQIMFNQPREVLLDIQNFRGITVELLYDTIKEKKISKFSQKFKQIANADLTEFHNFQKFIEDLNGAAKLAYQQAKEKVMNANDNV